MKDFFLLLGRLLIASLFIYAGVSKVLSFDSTATYIGGSFASIIPDYEALATNVAEQVKSVVDQDITLDQILAGAAIGLELGGGVFIILGWGTRFFAVLLFLFTIAVTYLFHAFWSIEDAAKMQDEVTIFMKNLSIMGALLMLAAAGPGGLSVSGGDRKEDEEEFL